MQIVSGTSARWAYRFLLGSLTQRLGGAKHVLIEETGVGPVHMTSFDDAMAVWMRQWASNPRDPRCLVIWDNQTRQAYRVDDTVVQRHSAGASSDGRQDTFTLSCSSWSRVSAPAWASLSSESQQASTPRH